MNTKNIGNIGEAKAIVKFIELGIPVYLPFGENERADMVIDVNRELLKIQVKTSTIYKNGCTYFGAATLTNTKDGVSKHKYTKYEIDYFIFYSIPKDELYMIPINECNQSSIVIRHELPKKFTPNIRRASDCIIDNIITKL